MLASGELAHEDDIQDFRELQERQWES
jgi:hypothetical protein